MKVLLVSTLYNPYEIGGAERSTRLIAKGLKKREIEVEILTTCNKDYVDYVDGIKVHYTKFRHVYWRYNSKSVSVFKKILWRVLEPINILNNRKLSRILKSINPDLIHTNNIAGISPAIWKQAKNNKIKILHTARDYYLLCAKSGFYKNNAACKSQCSLCSIYTSRYKKLSENVDAFVGVSDFVKLLHLKNGYFKNIKTSGFINNIYDAGLNNVVRTYNSEKPLKIGCIGFIRETKGVNQLLKNIDFSLNIELVIAGQTADGNYKDEFLKLIERDKVCYLGYALPEKFFNSIDVLIHPAVWHEPFPRVLIESFSYGIPVIASSTGGTKEAIEGKNTGFVFHDYRELNEILLNFINGSLDYHELSKSCLKFASQNFTEEKIINRYLEHFKILM